MRYFADGCRWGCNHRFQLSGAVSIRTGWIKGPKANVCVCVCLQCVCLPEVYVGQTAAVKVSLGENHENKAARWGELFGDGFCLLAGLCCSYSICGRNVIGLRGSSGAVGERCFHSVRRRQRWLACESLITYTDTDGAISQMPGSPVRPNLQRAGWSLRDTADTF